MHNHFKFLHVFVIFALILFSGYCLLWFINQFKLDSLLNIELIMLVVIYLIIITSTAFIIKTKHLPSIHSKIGFTLCKTKYIYTALAIAVIIWLLDYVLQVYLLNINMQDEAAQWYKNSNKIYFVFLASVIIAPIIEEMLFRGILLQSLQRHLSPFWSTVIVSGLFALVHFDLLQSLSLFIASLFFVWLTIKSNSIIPAITAHILNNLLTFSYYMIIIN